MLPLDEFKDFLPKYLSGPAQQSLFEELKRFPDNIDQRMYLNRALAGAAIYQGDGLCNLLITNLPQEGMRKARAMVLSNSCDISQAETATFPANIFYCPIISLRNYVELISHVQPATNHASHIDAIRKQHVSSMFFLPENPALHEGSIALLDRITSCASTAYALDTLLQERLFTLSNYGFYLLLYKLSVHFTRIRENVDRNALN
jgi:hypothetical protein